MKLKTVSFTSALFIFWAFVAVTVANQTVVMEYFYIPRCEQCPKYEWQREDDLRVHELVLKVDAEYRGRVSIEWLDATTDEVRSRLGQYNLTNVPSIVINYQYHISGQEITWEKLKWVIDAYLAGLDAPPEVEPNRITLPLVLVSGLVDGVNPCAFALLIFFSSLLFSIQRTRSDVLKMGAAYILGLFIVYLAIGLNLLHAVSFFNLKYLFAQIGAILIIVLGLFYVKDALLPSKFELKFPKRAIPQFKNMVLKSTIPAALVLGALVGLLEFPCTGGIYIGILVLLSIETTFLGGLTYLVLYNLMFIVPLVVLLLFASNVDTLVKMDTWRKEKRRQIKLISGVFMLALGFFLWYWILT